MNDDVPLYSCAECKRGVLNRRVKHCLYCGAQLPASALATPGEINERDARDRLELARRAHDASIPAAPDPADKNKLGDGIETVADVFYLVNRLLD